MLEYLGNVLRSFRLLLWGLLPALAFSAINPKHPGSLTVFVLLYCFVIAGFGLVMVCEYLPNLYNDRTNAEMIAIGIVITIFGLFTAYYGHDMAVWTSLTLRKLAMSTPPSIMEAVKSTFTGAINASYTYMHHAFTGK